MTQPIEAVYENGIFRPLQPVHLPEHQRVEVHVPAATPGNEEFDPEPPPWLDVETDLYVPMTVPSISLGVVKVKVEKGEPCIILPEELPDE
jgi:hypothetical protein